MAVIRANPTLEVSAGMTSKAVHQSQAPRNRPELLNSIHKFMPISLSSRYLLSPLHLANDLRDIELAVSRVEVHGDRYPAALQARVGR